MSGTGEAAPLTGMRRVLVVDDDAALSSGVKLALEGAGYQVRTIDQGARALEVAAVFMPDLIVLDVMMPVMDGWEVLRRLRACSTSEHIPVIMLTADDADASKVRGFELGADDYVTKPFSLRELRCRVAAVLRRSDARPADDSACCIPVIAGGWNVEFLRCKDVYYIQGIRNYTYVHTSSSRFLCRLTLGSLDQKAIEGFKRVHRSFIVNMNHVKGCGWASKSAYRLRLADVNQTDIPVSRALVTEVQRELGVRT